MAHLNDREAPIPVICGTERARLQTALLPTARIYPAVSFSSTHAFRSV